MILSYPIFLSNVVLSYHFCFSPNNMLPCPSSSFHHCLSLKCPNLTYSGLKYNFCFEAFPDYPLPHAQQLPGASLLTNTLPYV